MLACESDSVETVEALLRGGADTQLVDAIGHRAMDYSVTTGNQHILHMLQDRPPPGAKTWRDIEPVYALLFFPFSPMWCYQAKPS